MISKTYIHQTLISLSLICSSSIIVASDNIVFGIINDVAEATHQIAKSIVGEPKERVKHVSSQRRSIESTPQKSHRSHHQAKIKAQSIPVTQEVSTPQPKIEPKADTSNRPQATPSIEPASPTPSQTLQPKTSEPVPQATNMPVVSDPKAQ